jgi:phosphatidylglycerol---prolipoprotein diacylglyceryl transferase
MDRFASMATAQPRSGERSTKTCDGDDHALNGASVSLVGLLRPRSETTRRAFALANRQRLHVETFGWRSVADLEPQALGLTYWLEPGSAGKLYSATIRFSGRRIGMQGKPRPSDRFIQDESVEGIVPGSGPIAITTHVRDIAPGEWHISATLVDRSHRSRATRSSVQRRPRLPAATSSGTTAFAPAIQVRAPGAHLGAWPALVGVGVIVGISVQLFVAGHQHLPVTRVFLVSLVASLSGLIGAKLYYLIGHAITGDRGGLKLLGGACIQGFVMGAGIALLIGSRLLALPTGPLLDATAPGILFGMAIGRFGCFFGGCCAGRATASRWGLWSSDRRLGMRRIPVQLFESTIALLIGTGALVAAWAHPRPYGVVFVGAIALYTLGRQLLFPLRAGKRHTAYGRVIALGLAGLVLVADVTVASARYS